MKIGFFVSLYFCFSISAHALVIRGTAFSDGKPLSGVFINIVDSIDFLKSGVSDKNGNFSMFIDSIRSPWIYIEFEDASRERVGIRFNHLNIESTDTLYFDRLIFRRHDTIKHNKDQIPKFKKWHVRKLEKDIGVYINDVPFLMTLSIKYQAYYADLRKFPNWYHKVFR